MSFKKKNLNRIVFNESFPLFIKKYIINILLTFNFMLGKYFLRYATNFPQIIMSMITINGKESMENQRLVVTNIILDCKISGFFFF